MRVRFAVPGRRLLALVFACACFSVAAAAHAVGQVAAGPPPAGSAFRQAPVAEQQAQPATQIAPDRQMPPITFKMDVNYVEVDAVVVDERGEFVRDLRREDFQVLEGGRPQTIANFSLVQIPVERGDAPLFATQPIEPDVRTNVRPFDGRVYVIVLDNLHVSARHSGRVKRAVRSFIERSLGANDLAAIVTTAGRTDGSQDFTNSRRLLREAVDRFMGSKLRSPTLERLEQYQMQRALGNTGGITDPLEAERAHYAESSLGTLTRVASFLASLHGRRKALIFVSEGLDYNIHNVFENQYASGIVEEAREAMAAATRANVSIYSIDPRGLNAFGDELMQMETPAYDANASIDSRTLMEELRLSQDSLRALSAETGGFAAVDSSDLGSALDRITRENSTYYVLGYYPTNTARDGKFRSLDVRVTRPGVQVRARKGYIAPSGRGTPQVMPKASAGTSRELSAALESPIPAPGIGLSAFAAPFRGSGSKASVLVAIEADAATVGFAERNARLENAIELSLVAIDREGRVKGADRQTVEMALRPATYTLVQNHGVRLVTRLELEPGRYQLRVGLLETLGRRLGSVHYDLDVPDFRKPPLSMAGVVLSSSAAARVPTPKMDGELKRLVFGVLPTTARRFFRDDTLVVMTEVYDTRPGTPHNVDISTTIRGDDGRELARLAEQRSSGELQGARGGYGYLAEMKLAELPPGRYLLRVEARTTIAAVPPVARDVLIHVVDR